MIQAAAMSGMDFAKAEPRSRHWWLRARWVLDRIEDLNTEKVYQMQHAQHVSVLDYTLDKSAFDGHWEGANKILREVYQMHFPWAKGEGKQRRQREIDELIAKWKAKYGDPSDPKVQAHFQKVADALRRKSAEASKNNFAEQNKLRKTVTQVVTSRRRTAERMRKAKEKKPKGKK